MISQFLQDNYRDKEFIYIPNPGHIGDALIAYSTLQLFDNLNLRYKVGSHNHIYHDQYLVYGGGGNLIGKPILCKNFLLNNLKHNNILILPHTIKDVDNVIQQFNKNTTVFCREHLSYDYVKSVFNNDNVFIDNDMVFGLSCDEYKDRKNNGWHLNCFRLDGEKTNIEIPDDNIDFTQKCSFPALISSIKNIQMSANLMLNFIAMYDTISTNRLHVAIAGALLEKKVKLYPNSYYKNKAVYEYSIVNNYSNVTFVS